jgi:parallel beta-helix repeat protein
MVLMMLILFTVFVSSSALSTLSTCSIHDNVVLYVGGSGPGNYTRIQDAIDNASDYDTVFVYSGIYHEHVIVNKSINLVGIDRNTTIINGDNLGDVVSVLADDVNISGFTVENSGDTPMVDAGIEIFSDHNIITGNIIRYNGRYAVGIFLNGSSHTYIGNNHIFGNGNEGIYLENSGYNLIEYNEIFRNGHCSIVISNSNYNRVVYNHMYENHDAGVSLWPGSKYNEIAWNTMHDLPYSGVGIWWDADHNIVHHNCFYNNPLYGVKIKDADRNIIEHNTIRGSGKGIMLSLANYTVVKKNNFIENNCDATFENSSFNLWIHNFWDEHKYRWPKPIFGKTRAPWNQSKTIQWINFDWFPAQKPYKEFTGE